MYNKIKIKKGKEKAFINRHPWVFSGAIQSLEDPQNGEIVEVIDFKENILGYGFYSYKSQISCRIFHFTKEIVTNFPDSFFKEKIIKAANLRDKFIDKRKTNCYRLIHAEGDLFPGLIIDIYNESAVIQTLIKGTELLLDIIVDSLYDLGFKNVYVKNSSVNPIEEVSQRDYTIAGKIDSDLLVMENSLLFAVDIKEGQKTGFFIDQRKNRELIKQISKEKTVLNAFCYTGGFSVYAIAGGARSVHSVDISQSAIAMTEKNVSENFKGLKNHIAIKEDCFNYLRDMDEIYDLIILDPPAFVKSATNIEKGAKGYKDINLNALRKIKKDSFLATFSCSQHISSELFQKIVFSAAADSGRNVQIISHLSQPEDHPINIYHPEGEYLKGLLLHVE
ncbi:MAG TPA: class I SAM-dependent rRNA methyltransferase [Spirochaetota bacterium]|jgi:23S rRNA (cytosine1962-C5)-methyltransferase|nr:class I SAM-dependent rRNA methyltransferase [Spirochaetota bacterium]HOV09972.1 class I SAM-dependent rRNA methyltransferase [Spirochaetota bacterium]HPD78531.1 class I SAM-dependent rRNA methyltransferase [Spirochaetota bacterium]